MNTTATDIIRGIADAVALEASCDAKVYAEVVDVLIGEPRDSIDRLNELISAGLMLSGTDGPSYYWLRMGGSLIKLGLDEAIIPQPMAALFDGGGVDATARSEWGAQRRDALPAERVKMAEELHRFIVGKTAASRP